MKFYPSQLNKMVELITTGKLPYQDTILIGDNAIGKSEAIKQIVLRKLQLQTPIYFIDAVNRYFRVGKINAAGENIKFSASIVQTRLADENFNLIDTWSYYGTSTESIEIIYPLYEGRIQEMMKEFFGVTFSVELKETQEVRYESGEIGKLSSGYQAILRLLLELIYYDETKEKSIGNNIVVIDEVDEYLSPKTAGKLFPFLKSHFPQLSFITTTHSADFIAAAGNCNIIIMQRESFEVLDSNDFHSLDDVSAIFKEVFGYAHKNTKDEVQEAKLRQLINNRIAGAWGEEDDLRLAAINEDSLSKAQKIIYRQIKEW